MRGKIGLLLKSLGPDVYRSQNRSRVEEEALLKGRSSKNKHTNSGTEFFGLTWLFSRNRGTVVRNKAIAFLRTNFRPLFAGWKIRDPNRQPTVKKGRPRVKRSRDSSIGQLGNEQCCNKKYPSSRDTIHSSHQWIPPPKSRTPTEQTLTRPTFLHQSLCLSLCFVL